MTDAILGASWRRGSPLSRIYPGYLAVLRAITCFCRQRWMTKTRQRPYGVPEFSMFSWVASAQRLVQQVGTSGNIASSVARCAFEHNACIPDCQRGADGQCIFEFQDYFAHSRDPWGRLFPE
ncbi:unnamed protein product [Effrenium voratum]|nr:unnamed protein product [Effrenium voratum]